MKVLITASNGTVGTRVVQRLKNRLGVDVFEARRKPQTERHLLFDFNRDETIKECLKKVDKVVLITPASQNELETGVRFIQIAQETGIKHIVFMSIHKVESAPSIPHFASKIAIQKELEKSKIRWTTISPNNFFQNDFAFKSSLQVGIYPQPFGNVGLSRVDADDIADALVNALFKEELSGQIFPLVGPEPLTVDRVCAIYREILKKEMKYGGDDLDAWEQFNKAYLPAWLLSDWKQMYKYFQQKGLTASATDYIQQEKILGRAPKSFATFVQENAQMLKT